MICTTCKIDKDESCFNKNKQKLNGIYTICKECLKIKRDIKKEIKREYDKKYRLENNKIINKRNIEYQKTIPNEIRAERNRNYRRKNKTKYNENVNFYIKSNKYRFVYRSILSSYIKRLKLDKTKSTYELLGYNINKFKERIEFNFKDGMSWENHGIWHVDHKKPISAFKEGTSPKIVNLLSNLQPLWAKDNLIKGNNYKLTTNI